MKLTFRNIGSAVSCQCSNISVYVGNTGRQLRDSCSCKLKYIYIFTNAHKKNYMGTRCRAHNIAKATNPST